jgi:hypothetical protein
MANLYSNLPTKRPPNTNSSDGTVQIFNTYFSSPVELNVGTLNAMTGFFESRGFDPLTAKSIAVIIMSQADVDGYNPMTVLDNLTGLDGLEISELATQILNHNRYKTSFLGYTTALEPYHEIQRNIVEAAPPLPKSYSIVPSSTTIMEGNYLTFTINTVNVRNGVTLYWNSLGSTVSAADIYQGITSGSVVINNNSASVTLGILDDVLVETDEILNFNLKTGSSSGPVVATSAVTVTNKAVIEFIIADYIVIEYLFTTGSDLDTRTKLVSPLIGNYVGWGLDSIVNAPIGMAPTLLEFGGDNTGIGTESTLFNVRNFRNTYPTTANVKIDCRAQWYGATGTTPVGLKISLFKGGTMQKQGFTWVNPTAAVSQVYNTSLKQITLSSKIEASTGERFAVLNYNTFTGIGLLDTEDTTVY